MTGNDALASSAMPDWGWELSRTVGGYAFGGYWIGVRLAVCARRRGDGDGPLEVVTSDETEMRDAIGVLAV